MEVNRETFGGVELAYYQGERSTLITSDCKTVRPNGFDFSTSEILHTDNAESCSVVVLYDGKSWGLYHGYQITKLEEFFERWSILKNPHSQYAFLFGSRNFGNFEYFIEQHRRSVRDLLNSVLGISRTSQYLRWNNIPESSIEVVVNPLAKGIRVNLNS